MTELRAVGDDERKPQPEKTLVEAARSGDRRELLRATRLELAQTLANVQTPPHAVAALASRMLAVDLELRDMGEPEETAHGATQARTQDDSFDATAV